MLAEHEFAGMFPSLVPLKWLDGKLEISVSERFGQEGIYGSPLSVHLRELVAEGHDKGRHLPVHDDVPSHVVGVESDVDVNVVRDHVWLDPADALGEFPEEPGLLGYVQAALQGRICPAEVLIQLVGQADKRGNHAGPDTLAADEFLVGEPRGLLRDVLAAAMAHDRSTDDIPVAYVDEVIVALVPDQQARGIGMSRPTP